MNIWEKLIDWHTDVTEKAEKNVWKFGGVMLTLGFFIGLGL